MRDPSGFASAASIDDREDRPEPNDEVQENTLWDQMTAREGRDAARRAGMRAGDWQAELQLQEALRESRREREVRVVDGAKQKAERSFVDVGFHAFATEAIEEEQGVGIESAHDEDKRVTGKPSISATCARPVEKITTNGEESEHEKRNAAESDDEEDIDALELVITKDGVVPIALLQDVEAGTDTIRSADSSCGRPTAVTIDRRGAARCRLSDGGWEESKMGDPSDRNARRSLGESATDANDQSGKSMLESDQSRTGRDAAGRDKRDADVERPQADERGDGSPRMKFHAASSAEGGSGGRKDAQRDEKDEGVKEEELREERPQPFDIVLTLGDDVLHRLMLFLNPEDIFECRAVNSLWEFPGHEEVFEGLCRRTYLSQSAKKLLNVKRWRSWQRMFKLRPRMRTTGLYSLKTSYFKKPVLDMSTSWTPGTILEVTYWRHFRFFGDGRVAYGLGHENPKEFTRMIQESNPKVLYGTYTIRKWDVTVIIRAPWASVSFVMQLANGERGRFTHLVLLEHTSVPRNDPRSRCKHSVKSSDFFAFRRVWQF